MYVILKHSNKEVINKVSNKFINMVEKHMSKEYMPNINYNKNINEQKLMQETRIILSLIYRDYLCDEKKRKELIIDDENELNKIENELREKYNPDNLFRKKE